MYDLDVERIARHRDREEEMGDRQFKFGGETFVYRANPSQASLRPDVDGNIMVEETILRLLEDVDDGHKRFTAICTVESTDYPVTPSDLNDLLRWLIQKINDSPTFASSPYTVGDAPTTTASTAKSSSKAVAESAT